MFEDVFSSTPISFATLFSRELHYSFRVDKLPKFATTNVRQDVKKDRVLKHSPSFFTFK